MNLKYRIVALVVAVIYGLDQWTKWLVVKRLNYGDSIVVFPSWFDLVHYRNRGAAFGFLAEWQSDYRDAFFYVLSFLAALFLIQILRQIPADKKYWSFPIGLVLGGAIGNISDRIFRGSVVDFVLIHWNNQSVEWSLFGRSVSFDLTWPAFNVADAAITVGVFWLVYVLSVMPVSKRAS